MSRGGRGKKLFNVLVKTKEIFQKMYRQGSLLYMNMTEANPLENLMMFMQCLPRK